FAPLARPGMMDCAKPSPARSTTEERLSDFKLAPMYVSGHSRPFSKGVFFRTSQDVDGRDERGHDTASE
ncbi:hypothetical protein, partial [Rhodoplanes roseus]